MHGQLKVNSGSRRSRPSVHAHQRFPEVVAIPDGQSSTRQWGKKEDHHGQGQSANGADIHVATVAVPLRKAASNAKKAYRER
ncbi:hypothetical protein [Janthinobacterium sp.]|uniref:hypothetical protein n=1 Tax=Janthinobacterium sp. TaxID=1871054 RepID=UPI0026062D90|nr:hypothetical protein [Janthinobacterium sp.]